MVMPVYSSGAFMNKSIEIRSQMETLEKRLATGKQVDNFTDLGEKRTFDMSLRSRLAELDSYKDNIVMAEVRIKILDQSFKRLDEINTDMRSSTHLDDYELNGVNKQPSQLTAKEYMKEMISLLNTEVNGRYLFSGRASLTKPVEQLDDILHGRDGLDGLLTVAQERLDADMGADELGRMVLDGAAGATVSLSEDGDHPFGIKLSRLYSDNPDISYTQPNGTAPQTADITFAGTVLENQKVSLDFTMPDGTTSTMTLRAVDAPAAALGQFQIGPDAATTAANFNAALEDNLRHFVKSDLAAASRFEAANNFFDTSNGAVPKRVDGPPHTATALVNATETDTLFWYKADNEANSSRDTAQININNTSTISYGVRANEKPLAKMMASMSAFFIDEHDNSVASKERYAAAKERIQGSMGNSEVQKSVRRIETEIAIAYQSAQRANDRHQSETAVLKNLLDNIETAPTEQTVMELFALETRLQASYKTTSMLQSLNLMNFMK